MSRTTRARVLGGLVALVLVAVVAGAAHLWRIENADLDRLQAAEDADAAAVAAARDQALAWTTVDYREVDDYFDGIRERAGGDFLTELEETEGSLKKLTVKNESVQTATVPAGGAALVERSGDQATVVVAVDTSVTTVTQPEPQDRQYRLRLTLEREGATWLTTGLEFVG